MMTSNAAAASSSERFSQRTSLASASITEGRVLPLAPEYLADALVAQAHAEDGNLAAQRANRIVGHAGVIRRARSRRDDDAIELRELVDRDLIVAENGRLGTELGHVLDEVVREGVVVVDHRDGHYIPSAISMALNIAPAFSSVSSNSRSGLESATTPAPACT